MLLLLLSLCFLPAPCWCRVSIRLCTKDCIADWASVELVELVEVLSELLSLVVLVPLLEDELLPVRLSVEIPKLDRALIRSDIIGLLPSLGGGGGGLPPP